MKLGNLKASDARVGKGIPMRAATFAIALVAAIFLTGCTTATKPATAGKFYHVGLVWLKEPGNTEHRQQIIAAAHSFAHEIPEVQFLSVGQSPPSTSPYVDASFDICFVMRLEDKAALDRYGAHPVHQKAAHEVFLPLSRKILFYDFTSE
ncbi:MAG TPA: Dabb family protein [Lacipirellulaceae bacterium]|nr:Dabb family protein [Lacipirellulaceae bacterium]